MTKSKAVSVLAVTPPGPRKDVSKNPGQVPRRSSDKTCRDMRELKVEMPSKEELEEFLAEAEWEQRNRFMDKYNYDVEKDVPMGGRYEWVLL